MICIKRVRDLPSIEYNDTELKKFEILAFLNNPKKKKKKKKPPPQSIFKIFLITYHIYL